MPSEIFSLPFCVSQNILEEYERVLKKEPARPALLLQWTVCDKNLTYTIYRWGRDSSVTIATCYGQDDPRMESRWRRDFQHPSRPALGGPPSLLYKGYRDFPGGVALTVLPI